MALSTTVGVHTHNVRVRQPIIRAAVLAAVVAGSLWFIACGGRETPRTEANPPSAPQEVSEAQQRNAYVPWIIMGVPPAFALAPQLDAVYVVASTRAAAVVQKELEDANRLLLVSGEHALTYEVVVLSTAAEEAAFWRSQERANLDRASAGLPTVSLIDLR